MDVGCICYRAAHRKSLHRMDRMFLLPFHHGLMTDKIKTHRSTLLAGLISLVGGTVLFCFGRKLYILIFARVLQGISSALVWIVCPSRKCVTN